MNSEKCIKYQTTWTGHQLDYYTFLSGNNDVLSLTQKYRIYCRQFFTNIVTQTQITFKHAAIDVERVKLLTYKKLRVTWYLNDPLDNQAPANEDNGTNKQYKKTARSIVKCIGFGNRSESRWLVPKPRSYW